MNEDHGNQHASGGGGSEADGQPRAPAPLHEHTTPKAPPISPGGAASAGPVTRDTTPNHRFFLVPFRGKSPGSHTSSGNLAEVICSS